MNRSTIYAASAIVLWASLATLGKFLLHVPPFFLLGVAFSFGALPGLLRFREVFVTKKILFLGTFGLFGYHAFLFLSFHYAPPIEANIINYLWPVLIILFTPLLLKNYPIRWNHMFGCFIAFVGCWLLISGGRFLLKQEFFIGYFFALGAAITWALYSVLTKKVPSFSSHAVAGFCICSAVLAFIVHFSIESSANINTKDWLFLLALGLGPMGLAFYLWDAAIKIGDPRQIAMLSYCTPLLSTLGLVLFGAQALNINIIVALVLIVLGAVLGTVPVITKIYS